MNSLADLLILAVLIMSVLIYMRLGRIEQMLGGRRSGGPRRYPGRGKVVPWPGQNDATARIPPEDQR